MRKGVDILLVNPSSRTEQYQGLSNQTMVQPLGLVMLASYIRQHGYTVKILDAEADNLTIDETLQFITFVNPEFIGMTVFTTKMNAVKELCRLIKRHSEIKIILGGHHVTAVSRETLYETGANYVVVGEGYYPIIRLLSGVDCEFSYVKESIDLDELDFGAWDLLSMSHYKCHHWQAWNNDLKRERMAAIYTSRGCPYDCDYCSVNLIYADKKVRYRCIDSVIDEMELLINKHDVKYFEIIDDTFTFNRQYVLDLCEKIIWRGLKIKAWCYGRVNHIDKKLAKMMKLAGIEWVFFGIESGNDKVLKGVNKKQTVDQIENAIEICRYSGMNIGGNYMFGLPDDTQETMQQTLDFAKHLNLDYANFSITMAYPGTKLYNSLPKDKLPTDWDQYGLYSKNAMSIPNTSLTSKDIVSFRDYAFNEYYTTHKYQDMIGDKFGGNVVDFLNNDILSKDIERA